MNTGHRHSKDKPSMLYV